MDSVVTLQPAFFMIGNYPLLVNVPVIQLVPRFGHSDNLRKHAVVTLDAANRAEESLQKAMGNLSRCQDLLLQEKARRRAADLDSQHGVKAWYLGGLRIAEVDMSTLSYREERVTS